MKLDFSSQVRRVSGFFRNIFVALTQDIFSLPAIFYFYQHIKPTFQERAWKESQSEILMELNSQYFSHPGYAYLLGALRQRFRSKAVVYSAYSSPNRLAWWFFQIRASLPIGKFLSYRGMGVRSFIKPRKSASERRLFAHRAAIILGDIRSKGDLEDLVVDGTHVGDLLYGAYLSTFQQPTVRLGDSRLVALLAAFLELLDFWKRYFEQHDVRAVITSHLVYEMAIPIRVALGRSVDCFHLADSGSSLTRVTSEHPHHGIELACFHEKFLGLSEDQQRAALEMASKRLEARFSGFGDSDLNSAASAAYSTVNRNTGRESVFDPKDKFRVLIAGHLFWDSPHFLGKAIFPDFYEWLTFLGNFSRDSSFSWYLKPHPDGEGKEGWIYDEFLSEFPHIRLVSHDISHHQILAEGVDVVLTVHGTIAFEYPLHGVPVINASAANPHAAYQFSATPLDEEGYAAALAAVSEMDRAVKKEEVLEYYFMKNIFYSPNIFFRDFSTSIVRQMHPNSAKALVGWVKSLTPESGAAIENALANFVRSGDPRLCWMHYGLEEPAERLF